MRTVALLCLAVASLATMGCAGKGAAYITIEASGPDGNLVIPDNVDKITLEFFDPDVETAVLQKEYPLTGADGVQFPVTLGIEEGSYDGKTAKVHVSAYKADRLVAEAETLFTFNSKDLTKVTVQLVVLDN